MLFNKKKTIHVLVKYWCPDRVNFQSSSSLNWKGNGKFWQGVSGGNKKKTNRNPIDVDLSKVQHWIFRLLNFLFLILEVICLAFMCRQFCWWEMWPRVVRRQIPDRVPMSVFAYFSIFLSCSGFLDNFADQASNLTLFYFFLNFSSSSSNILFRPL